MSFARGNISTTSESSLKLEIVSNSLSSIISFSFIEDTLEGILKILDYETSDVFNIGNDHEIKIIELANKIIDLTNSNSKIVNKDLPIDDPKQRKPDLSKAKKQIQIWEPQSLKVLIYKLNDLELIVKKNLYNSLNLVVDFLSRFSALIIIIS